MGRKRTPGLRFRGGIWHIEKQIFKTKINESTGTGNLAEAEAHLARRIEEVRRAVIYGDRPRRRFREASIKYLEGHMHKASIRADAFHLKCLDDYIGDTCLDQVHDGTLEPFIQARLKKGVRRKSINLALEIVRRILNLSARKWRDERGITWLETAALLTMLSEEDSAKPYPLSWDEQKALIKQLPAHLANMTLFKVNAGCRDTEVCSLKWEWEVIVPELKTSVFIIPAGYIKNKEDRLVVLNDVAKSVIESQRGKHPDYVFTYKDKAMGRMHNTAWKRAWKKAGLPVGQKYVRGPHNLKHTFGRRLRAAGVPLETRKVLLGHKNGDITTHYSAPEISELITAANRICGAVIGKSPALTLLRRNSTKLTAVTG